MANRLTFKSSIPGELPPLPPRTLFGRDELIERVVDLAENHFPITLVGAGGIGKTSIALTVLHHDRIKKRFGDDRRFIRCDQFPASRCHLLRRLSSVIGAGIENPEDLTPLRTYLSSRKMLIVLDNAESILDTQGTDAQKIHAIVEELGRFDNICICITSRNPPTPLRCERLDVPTLSMDAALDTFYHIYGANNRSNIVNGIPEELDFHPLSITLLATAARQNKWDANRLATEWGKQRTTMVQAEHNKNLAAAIEFSLASPMFQQLGHDARALLGVVAFFPQGVDENNLTWLFPTITNRTDVFNKFCILSLTQRSNGFITMFAPLRGYLSPKDPMSSPLLCTTMERYFSRMSNFGETRWVTSEEANIEHLLDVFTTIDGNSNGVWEACINFMKHFVRHKNRSGSLKLKMEALPDDHPSKPGCLYELSWLCRIGNDTERKRLLTRALKLYNERGNDPDIAKTLVRLSHVNRTMDRRKEGIRQARQALEILEWLGDTKGQIDCLIGLARLLRRDKQLDAAKEVASRAIGLIPEKGNQYQACETHHILGRIYRSKGDGEKAIHHFEEAIGIASSLNWHHELLWVYWSLAELFSHQGKSDDARAHLERAKSHAVGNTYGLGHVMFRQAWFWFKEHRLEEVRSEVLRAAEIFEKLGAAKELEQCRVFLRTIRFLQVIRFPWGMQKKLSRPTTSVQSVSNCECLYSCNLLCVLTLRSKLGELIGGINGCVDLLRESPVPYPLASPSLVLVNLVTFFSKNVIPFYLHHSVFVVLPLAVYLYVPSRHSPPL